jgi:hypothetical protein
MPPTNTSYNVTLETSVKFNSLSNILHKVLDQIIVLPCWLDLPTILPWGLRLLEGNLDVNDVPPPFEDMMQDDSSHVTLSTCKPPPMWGILDQLEKVIDWHVLQAWQSLPPTPIAKMTLLPVDGPQNIFYYRPCLFYCNLMKNWYICLLKLFGGISNGLVIMLQESIHIHKYSRVIMCHYVYNTLKNNLLFTFWRMFFY